MKKTIVFILVIFLNLCAFSADTYTFYVRMLPAKDAKKLDKPFSHTDGLKYYYYVFQRDGAGKITVRNYSSLIGDDNGNRVNDANYNGIPDDDEIDGDIDDDDIPDSEDDDIDGDTIVNDDDEDIDGDGTPNSQDDDIDGDGIANSEDDDIDGDGVNNKDDYYPYGKGGGIDPDNDIDGDGIVNSKDNDIDGDGIPNSQDDDIDGDGIPNSQDDTPSGKYSGGSGSNPGGGGGSNPGGGGGSNPGGGGGSNPGGGGSDLDGDGIPDSEDDDIDGDGIPNSEDDTPNGDDETIEQPTIDLSFADKYPNLKRLMGKVIPDLSKIKGSATGNGLGTIEIDLTSLLGTKFLFSPASFNQSGVDFNKYRLMFRTFLKFIFGFTLITSISLTLRQY